VVQNHTTSKGFLWVRFSLLKRCNKPVDPEEVQNRGSLSGAIQWIFLAVIACVVIWFLPISREWRVAIIAAVLAAVVVKVANELSKPFERLWRTVVDRLKRPVTTFSFVALPLLRGLRAAVVWWWNTLQRNPAIAVFIAVILAAGGEAVVAGTLRIAKPQTVLVVAPFEVPPPSSGGFIVTGRRLAKVLVDQLDMIMHEASPLLAQPTSKARAGGDVAPLRVIPPPEASGAEIANILGGPLNLLIDLWRTIRYQRVYVISGDVAFSPGELTLLANSGRANTWHAGPFPSTEVGLKGACYELALAILSDMKADIVGQFYLARRDYDKAIAQFKKALQQKPKEPETLNNLGVALDLKGQVNEAVAAYNEALALKQDFAEAQNNLGGALADKGQFDDAIAAYRKALQLRPNFPEAMNNLGLALAQKDPSEAIALFKQALVARPDFAESLSNMGFVLNNEGHYDEAINYLQRALQLRPDYPEALNNLGFAFNTRGRYDEAIPLLRKAVALKPDYHAPFRHLGDALAAKGQLDDAIASYRKAIELKPDYPKALYGLAIALGRKGDDEVTKHNLVAARPYFAEAQQRFSEAEQFDPALKPPKR